MQCSIKMAHNRTMRREKRYSIAYMKRMDEWIEKGIVIRQAAWIKWSKEMSRQTSSENSIIYGFFEETLKMGRFEEN